jgi:hypothetical protein
MEEYDKRQMKRIKANDPAAIREMGARRLREGDTILRLSTTQKQPSWEIQKHIIN